MFLEFKSHHFKQAEMLDRKERRAAELAEFKEKTKTVLRSFEVKVKDAEPEENLTCLSDHTIDMTIGNIGVAFPSLLTKTWSYRRRVVMILLQFEPFYSLSSPLFLAHTVEKLARLS